ncbi:MAG: sugar kinase [Bdellovibrionales bacterium GWA2_49_15]|nr:MAG: sugar kinase [Bdellovibrionales bacterium GWA2_49_15]HAZ13480.1 adenosine kinase [Bdellovibrionales bacterium]
MAVYDVYGLGNALVDMEFEVTDSFLQKMKIEKGLMTLVDEARQNEIIEAIHGLQHKRSCGGSAANTVIAVSQLGGRSFYSCKVANCELGDFYYQDLMREGVHNNWSGKGRPQGTTGRCMVFITPDAERTMNTHLGITSDFSKLEVDEEIIKNSKILYIEGYLVASPLGREAAIHAKALADRHGVKTAITFSDSSMPMYFKQGLLEIIGTGVDLLFCNESEAKIFAGKDGLEDSFRELKRFARTFAITQGPKGALLFDGSKEIDVVTAQVDAIDTNGAGDLFAGAFLYALSTNQSFAMAGKLACAAASTVVTQFGARLKREQIQNIKKVVFGY